MKFLHKNKKFIISLLFVSFLCVGNVTFAQEKEDVTPHEIGIYFKDYFPVGAMKDHANNFIGGGLSYNFHTPWLISIPESVQSVFGESLNFGFSARFDYEYCSANDYVNSWNVVNGLLGAFVEWTVNDWLIIQPSIEYGVQLDKVSSTRKANKLYASQSLQLSPTFKFSIPAMSKYGFTLEASPLWSIGFEKTHSANYLGMRFGLMYHIGGSSVSKADVEEIPEEPDEIAEPVESVVEEPQEVIPEPEPIIEEPAPIPEPEPEVPVVATKVEVKMNADGTVAINIPTLSFKSDSAELTDDESNTKTIKQVFDILSDSTYEEYKVVITGYVNPDGKKWTSEEKKLALSRAQTVKTTLVSMGISENRLEARNGSGKTENKEYNRRVEFILTK